MPQYLLSVHAPTEPAAGEQEPPDPERMAAWFAEVDALEQDMEAQGVWLFSGRLSAAGSATVVRSDGSTTLTTDGPYAETKEHIAGFYIIEAADLDDALRWAGRVTDCIGAPIELRPFTATGRVQLPPQA